MLDFLDVLVDVVGRVVNDRVVEPFRKARLEVVHLLADGVDDPQGVGVGVLVDQGAAGGLAVDVAGRLEIFRQQLDAGDVIEPDDRTVVAPADDDLLKLGGLFQTALQRDREFEVLTGRDRTGADLAGGGLHVFLLDRLDHLRRGDLHVRQPVGVDPDPHRILTSEHVRVTNAVDPLEDVGDVNLPVIVEEIRVVPAVGRDQVHDADHVRRRLLDRDAVLLHLRGELGSGRLHPVLDVDGRHVLRVADVERGDDVRHAVTRAVGVEVNHPLRAIDLLFDRRGDSPGDAQGVGPGVGRRHLHLHLRRGDLRVLGDRQPDGADAADQKHQERRDRGEDRPADKEVDHNRRNLR